MKYPYSNLSTGGPSTYVDKHTLLAATDVHQPSRSGALLQNLQEGLPLGPGAGKRQRVRARSPGNWREGQGI